MLGEPSTSAQSESTKPLFRITEVLAHLNAMSANMAWHKAAAGCSHRPTLQTMLCRLQFPALPAFVNPLGAGDMTRPLPPATPEGDLLACQHEIACSTPNKAALAATKPIPIEHAAQLTSLGAAFEDPDKRTEGESGDFFGTLQQPTMLESGVHSDAAGHAAMTEPLMRRLLP